MSRSIPLSKNESQALHKVFDVASSGRLFISVPGADIQLASSDANRVEIDVFVSAPTENEALSFTDRVKLRVRAVDKQTVRVESKSIYQDGFFGWNTSEVARMRMEIKVPRTFNIDIQAAGCDIELDNLKGQLALQVSGSTLKASRLHGKLELFSYGSVADIDGFDGSKLTITASGGRLDARRLKAPQIAISASGTETTLADLEGATDLIFHSGFADVRGVKGPLDARTSACACTLHLANVEDTQLEVSGGELALHLAKKAAARVLLEGRTLIFDDAFAFAGEREAERIDGHLNEGKNWLRAFVASGAIRCVAA
ncbi:MAG: DUF4097 family beta strand repeat-containing protein [Rhodothermales bacterium]